MQNILHCLPRRNQKTSGGISALDYERHIYRNSIFFFFFFLNGLLSSSHNIT